MTKLDAIKARNAREGTPINPDEPEAVHDRRWLLALVDTLVNVASAAMDVSAYDWSENDPDAVEAIEHLRSQARRALAALIEPEETK